MEIKLVGNTISLRPVHKWDSAFIANLRSDPNIFKYLSSNQATTAKEQEHWLEYHYDRNDGYYFIIEDKQTKKKTGTISIYNITESPKIGEFGRYICLNPVHAIEAELLLIRFAFEKFGLSEIYCRTAKANKKVWKQHYRFGFIDTGEEILEAKKMSLLIQRLTRKRFEEYNYTPIIDLINRFKKEQ